MAGLSILTAPGEWFGPDSTLPPVAAAVVGAAIAAIGIWSLLIRQVRSNIDTSQELRQRVLDENVALRADLASLRAELSTVERAVERLEREVADCHRQRDAQSAEIRHLRQLLGGTQ